jgi:hypothetical protein
MQKNRPTQGEAVQDTHASPHQQRSDPEPNISQSTDLGINEPSSNGELSATAGEAVKSDVYDNLDRLRVNRLPEANVRPPKNPIRVVKRPPQWFRTNPDPAYTLCTTGIEWGPTDMDKTVYLVDPALREALEDEDGYRDFQLYLVVDPDDNPFIWPVKVAREEDGRGADWAESAEEAAQVSMTKWIKIKGDKVAGVYVIREAPEDMGDPRWPVGESATIAFSQLLRTAFGKKRYLDSLDHPVVKKIQGRVTSQGRR